MKDVREISRDKVHSDELLRDVHHADNERTTTITTLEAVQPGGSRSSELLLLLDGSSGHGHCVVDVEPRTVELEERLCGFFWSAFHDEPGRRLGEEGQAEEQQARRNHLGDDGNAPAETISAALRA